MNFMTTSVLWSSTCLPHLQRHCIISRTNSLVYANPIIHGILTSSWHCVVEVPHWQVGAWQLTEVVFQDGKRRKQLIIKQVRVAAKQHLYHISGFATKS